MGTRRRSKVNGKEKVRGQRVRGENKMEDVVETGG
jgi:hypothetical protein